MFQKHINSDKYISHSNVTMLSNATTFIHIMYTYNNFYMHSSLVLLRVCTTPNMPAKRFIEFLPIMCNSVV